MADHNNSGGNIGDDQDGSPNKRKRGSSKPESSRQSSKKAAFSSDAMHFLAFSNERQPSSIAGRLADIEREYQAVSQSQVAGAEEDGAAIGARLSELEREHADLSGENFFTAHDGETTSTEGVATHTPAADDNAAGAGSDTEQDKNTPLAFEHASPAEAAILALIPPRPTGTAPGQVAACNFAMTKAGVGSHFITYVEALAASERPDREECFEMVALLAKRRRMLAGWMYAWPIDIYLAAGPFFGGSWYEMNMQKLCLQWRAKAIELYDAGASRDELSTFAALFEDARSLGTGVFMRALPELELNALGKATTHSVAEYMLQEKYRIWNRIYTSQRQEWVTTKQRLLSRWNEAADPSILDDFEQKMKDDANSGSQRPLPPAEWEFHLAWKQMALWYDAKATNDSQRLQYTGLLMMIQEFHKRYRSKVLPLINAAEMDDFDCDKFCEDMWSAVDAESAVVTSRVFDEWKDAIHNEMNDDERSKLQLRFALMLRNIDTGWAYGVKTPARPREHLWDSIEARLKALGMTPSTSKTFYRFVEMSHVLAGSGILVEPPVLLHGVDSNDYIFNTLQPAFVEQELAYYDVAWNIEIAKDLMDCDASACMSSMAAEARRSGRAWGPHEAIWKQQWAFQSDIFVKDNPSSILAGRFRDLHQAVQDFAELFGPMITPDSSQPTTFIQSNEERFGRISQSVRKKMDELAQDHCEEYKFVAVDQNTQGERTWYENNVRKMRSNVRRGRPYFRPWEPSTDISVDRDSRARGSGTDRGAVTGSWTYAGKVGQGGFGQVSCWHQVNENNQVVDRMILKEAFLEGLWDEQTYWDGNIDLRRPREYFFAKYLTDLPDSDCITKPKGYGVYENLKMIRLYQEYCQHGDLYGVLREYKFDPNEPVDVKVPTRLIWAVFDSLVSALCLMRDGHLPGKPFVQPPGGEAYKFMMHMDIKDNNVFLATGRLDIWPGLPTAKLGDFGLALQETDPNSDKFYGGTQGWKAPEQYDYSQLTPSRVAPQQTYCAADVWAVGRVIQQLMNSERVSSEYEYTYEVGQIKPSFNHRSAEAHPLRLQMLVQQCLRELPGDRPLCSNLWQDIQEYVAKPDVVSGVAPKNRQADPAAQEVLRIREHIHLAFTERDEDA